MLYGRGKMAELPLPVWQRRGNGGRTQECHEERGGFRGCATAPGALRGLEGLFPPHFWAIPSNLPAASAPAAAISRRSTRWRHPFTLLPVVFWRHHFRRVVT